MSLIIMDTDFRRLGELAQAESLTLTRSYCGVGAFEAVTDPRAAGALTLTPGRVAFLSDTPQRAFLIEETAISRTRLTAKGTMLKGLCARRVCVPPLTLPARLWRYASGTWAEVTDAVAIRRAMTEDDVYQGFERPESPGEGALFLDMTELAAVYDWGAELGVGDVVSDLGTARLRGRYQNFGWDRFTGDAESAYLHYAAVNLIAPEDARRAVPRLVAAENRRRGETLPWQARFDRLDALFEQIGTARGVGWDVWPDYANERFVLGAWAGRDLTGAGAAVVSERMGNASAVQTKSSHAGSANAVYVGGGGEDENRLILCVCGEESGLDRRETWAEAGSLTEPELLRLYGRGKLQQLASKGTMSAELVDSGACRFGRDYDVGDRVVVQDAFGGSMTARVTEARETFENGKRTLDATFGDAAVSLGAVWRRSASAAR